MRLNHPALPALVVGTLLLAGCGGSGDYKEAKKGQDVEKHEEAAPPHGGHLIHLEPHHAVHLELTFDAEARKATFYVLAEKDEKWDSHPLEDDALHFHYEPDGATDEVELEFKAVRADGETTSSEFVVEGDDLPESIKDEEDIVGHVHIDLDGKEHVGDVSHEGHDHPH